MDRQELVAVVEEAWRQLDAATEGLDEAAMAEPGVVENWSVKDLLGHVTAWEQMALRHVEQWRSGETPAGLGGASLDAYNASEAARRHQWPLARLRDDVAGARHQLRTTLTSLTDDQWAAVTGEGERRASVGDWVCRALGGPLGAGTHAAEHAGHIWTWRAARERRCTEQITLLVEARRALLRALDGLSDDDLTRAGEESTWSVRESLAHLAAWDRQATHCIAAWLDGAATPAPVADGEAFNAAAAQQARGESPAATLLALGRAHDDFLAVVQRAAGRAGDLQYPWDERGDLHHAMAGMAAHEREHTALILAWRENALAQATHA